MISSAKYLDDKTHIEILIEKLILPELLNLSRNYTKYSIEFIFNTQSSHAIRWYQLACHWLNNRHFSMKKREIREVFKIDKNKYLVTRDFNVRLIKEPLQELKDKADIYLTYKPIKQGRTIVQYDFTVHQKKKTKQVTTSPVIQTIKKSTVQEKPKPKEIDYWQHWLSLEGDKWKHLFRKYNLSFSHFYQKTKNTMIDNQFQDYVNFKLRLEAYLKKCATGNSESKITEKQIKIHFSNY